MEDIFISQKEFINHIYDYNQMESHFIFMHSMAFLHINLRCFFQSLVLVYNLKF